MRIYSPKYWALIALGNTLSIMHAETLAIDLTDQECLQGRIKGKRIYILFDSQAAIKAISANSIRSQMVWECRQSFKNFAMGNKIALSWLPGHDGIERNEIANELTRAGFETLSIGPESFCGLTNLHRREEIFKWELSVKMPYWEDTLGER